MMIAPMSNAFTFAPIRCGNSDPGFTIGSMTPQNEPVYIRGPSGSIYEDDKVVVIIGPGGSIRAEK